MDSTVNLTDFMDSRYGAGSWSQRTGVGIGTDIGPALSDALNYLRTNCGRGKVIIPSGTWLMTNPPTSDQYSGNYIEGYGSQASLVVYNANSGSPFSFSGNNGYSGGGIRGVGILLEDGYPTSTAQGISLRGNATYQPDQTQFNDIYMSAIGSSYWYDGFFAYGNDRVTPQGIRVGYVTDLQVFRCRNTGIYLSNIVQWVVDNVGIYVGQGTGNNMYLAGGGTSLKNSIQVDLRRIAVSGDLNLTNVTKFFITGSANSVVGGSSADIGYICMACSFPLSGSLGSHVTTIFL